MDDTSLYLLIFVIVGVSVAYAIDDLAILSKGFGGLYKSNALAANLGSTIYLFNRIFMASTLPALGYLVDSGISAKEMIITVIIAAVLMLFLKIITYYNIIRIIITLNWVAGKLYGKDRHIVDHSILLNIEYKGKINWQPVLAMIMFIASMTIPSIIAIFFFENRAFFVQLGFLFNMFGSLITILFIERKIALSAEKVALGDADQSSFISSISSIILSRALGSFIYALIMASFLIFILE